ncbi:MAG: hypothetical protein ACI86M_003442 [Saprospiraceae bacterium]|jgi:hypothetical protein
MSRLELKGGILELISSIEEESILLELKATIEAILSPESLKAIKIKQLEDAIEEGERSGFSEGYDANDHLKRINENYPN